MTEAGRILADFQGCWSLERDVRHLDGGEARFSGTATWTPEGETLVYDETGWLTMSGQKAIPARQRYIWMPDLTVRFSDGRFFHRVPGAGGATAHGCTPDHYEGAYDFSRWPEFRVTWRVTGPRKDYRMLSTYRRSPV